MNAKEQQAILKVAALILKERALDKRINELREQRYAIRKQRCGSYGMSHGEDRQDLTFEIPLAEYLVAFADKPHQPVPQSFDYETEDAGAKVKGVKQYFRYPPQFIGTLATKPPTHVWTEATTETAWAPGDPKPVTTMASNENHPHPEAAN